ncbi:unnamed protein product [Rhodiola kirilowii]
MAPELYSTVKLRQVEKKHYNNKVDAYEFAIVLSSYTTSYHLKARRISKQPMQPHFRM